ncbi:MAG: DUF4293 domain-containing protein, partial [Dysgonomonas sp.]
MIQRIQSVYLLLVAVLMSVTVFSPLMVFSDSSGIVFLSEVAGITFKAVNQYPTWGVLIFAVLAAIFPFINIFLYKKRKLQIKLCNITTLLIVLFYITLGVYTFVAKGKLDFEFTSIQYGVILPLVALIFNFLAQRKIKADEKLVRSLDRIR